jgi:ATP-dependent helicase Lhr and Lhr-like helicase
LPQIDTFKLIHPGLQKLIQDKGWKTGLTDIQNKAIPIILQGGNCIIEAPTSGGKTEAVFFPCFTNAAKTKSGSVQVLYIAPLRALLNDIETRANEYAAACGLHCFKWHGDVSQTEKIKSFDNPPDILLTTPESLEAILLRKSNWAYFFKDLQTIIIDEAHNFAPVDRGCHLITVIERLCYKLNKLPQRIAITATVGNPDEMLKWLAGSNTNIGTRIFVEAKQQKEKDFQIQFFYDKKTPEGNELPASYCRLVYLYNQLLAKKSIVFGGSRTNCESIATAINKINDAKKRNIPVKVRTHHSSVSKYYREEAESKIKLKNDIESGIDCIISTSTLELGIDIGQLDQVFQLNAISSSSSFLQRVGRTGRRLNRPQFFRGLITDEEELLLLIGVVNLGLKGISENIYFPQKAFHILAHQLICLCLQDNGIKQHKAWQILSRSYCFSKITEKQFNQMIEFMLSKELLNNIDGELVTGNLTEKYYLGSNWLKLFAVFSSGPLYEVFNEKNHVGNLDSAFVEALEAPFFFVLGGIEWEAYEVKNESRQVFARKTKIGNAPRWKTFSNFDIPFETAQEVGKVLILSQPPYYLNPGALTCFQSIKLQYVHLNWDAGKWIFIEETSGCRILTFSGDKINRTLACLISFQNIGKSTSDYTSVFIKQINNEQKVQSGLVLEFLTHLKDINDDEYESYLMLQLEEKTPSIKSSKFAVCIPDNLISATIIEKSYNLNALINELKNNKIEIFKNTES